MMRSVLCLFVLGSMFHGNPVWGQDSKYALATHFFATRFYLAHNIGLEYDYGLWRMGAYVGYNPERLMRYNHFAYNFKGSINRKLIQNEKLSIQVNTEVVTAFRLYPNNASQRISSVFCGYGLTYGTKFQFTQVLALGASHFNPNVHDLKPYWVHDFYVSVGVRYFLHWQNEY